ncbi:MAG: site-specific integrase, partial [Rhodocyclaceae bacterium]
MTAQASVGSYLAELAEQRRQSPLTVASYRRDLAVLCELCRAAGDTALNAVEAHQIRRFVTQLHARGLGGRSLARTLSAWRGFYRWLGLRGLATQNPVDGIRAPKSPKALPKVLSPDEASRLLAAGSQESQESADALAVRDLAMFELLYSSGLRLAELASLDLSCVDDIADGEVRVLGKRSKPRLVPVGSK